MKKRGVRDMTKYPVMQMLRAQARHTPPKQKILAALELENDYPILWTKISQS